MTDEEKLYESLNKRLTFYLKVIKNAIWPITLIFTIIGIWWGVDFSQARKEINNYRDEIQTSIKINQLSSRELDVSVKELSQTSIISKQRLDSMADQLQIRIARNDSLIKRNEAALRESEKLFNEILDNNNNLTGLKQEMSRFVESLRQDIVKIRDDYRNELSLAKMGVEERIDIEEKMLSVNRDVQIKLRQLVILLGNFFILETQAPYVTITPKPENNRKSITQVRKEQQEILDEFNKISKSIIFP